MDNQTFKSFLLFIIAMEVAESKAFMEIGTPNIRTKLCLN